MITTVFAQVSNRGIPTLSGLFGGTGGGVAFLGALLSLVVTIILIVGGLYFFIQLLTGGVAWIGSGGDKGKLEEARQKIFSAVLGLVLLFSAFAFIRLAESVFQVGILNFNVPTIGQTFNQFTGGGSGGGGALITP